FTVLEDHQSRSRVGLVLSGDVDPVVAFHAVIDLADVGELIGEFAGSNAGLKVGKRRESRHIQLAAKLCTVDNVVKSMEFAQWLHARRCIPKVGAGKLVHLRTGDAVDDKVRFDLRLDDEEEIGTAPGPSGTFLQILGGKGRGDGIAQGGSARLSELREL